MERPVRHIVIVGGGTAGWLTAAVLAAEHRADRPDGLRVSVVESPDVAIIGVGEGTWPTMRDTLQRIGVSEADFIRECDASFKQGSRFDRWITGADDDRYFHPFSLPHGHGEVDLPEAWRASGTTTPFAEFVGPQPHLCLHGRAPKQARTPEWAAVANYAYHLDAGRFADFLRRHCTGRLGVRHVADHVLDVRLDESGDIAGLDLRAGGAFAGDLYVDCTGFQALLLGRLGVPFRSQRQVLFNDRALAVQVPYDRPDAPVPCQTTSTAQDAGWIWDIGLPTRRGLGHVYSGAHLSDERAADALEAHVRVLAPGVEVPTPRLLRFDPGYRVRPWARNCVAIGLSAGFIEPLEASAIALVELSAAMLADQLPATRTDMDRIAARFNAAFTDRWSRVIDFLKLHYVLSRRRDGDFWCDHADPMSMSAGLREWLAVWRHRPPSRYDFTRVDELFPSASWQYILYGSGVRPDAPPGPRRHADPVVAAGYLQETAQQTRKLLDALPPHRALLDHITRHGLPRI